MPFVRFEPAVLSACFGKSEDGNERGRLIVRAGWEGPLSDEMVAFVNKCYEGRDGQPACVSAKRKPGRPPDPNKDLLSAPHGTRSGKPETSASKTKRAARKRKPRAKKAEAG